jgi:hypothetical protein
MGRAPSRREIPSISPRGARHNEIFGFYPDGQRCLGCGELLGDAADDHTVFTRLACGLVFLHPGCAVEYGAQLMKEGMLAIAEATEPEAS